MRWLTVLLALEDFLKADSFAAVVAHVDGTPSIGIGTPGAAEAPCVWLARGNDGERSITLSQEPEGFPGQYTFTAEVWAVVPDGATESIQLRSGYQALSDLEDAFLAALRRFFSPKRETSSILGGTYAARITQVIPLADDSGGRQMGSLFTVVLNGRA
jgi:hypothetical protein